MLINYPYLNEKYQNNYFPFVLFMSGIQKLYHYFIFIRPFAFIGIFITFICSSIIAYKTFQLHVIDFKKILIGAIACGLMASAAHAINNIFDKEIDAINKPDRPIPKKIISIKEAAIITGLLYITSFVCAALIDYTFLMLIGVMFIFTLLYSLPFWHIKKYGILANICIAIPRGLLIILAGWYVIGPLDSIIPWYIGIISLLFLIGAVTTKDIADIKGDKAYGCKTLPIQFGLKKTVYIISGFYIIPFLLIPIGIFFNILIIETLPLTFLIFYGIYILILMKNHPDTYTKIEKNHISWKHTYILYMVMQLGMGGAYLL